MTTEKDDYTRNETETMRNCFKLAAAFILAIVFFTAAPVHAREFARLPDGKGNPKYVFLFIGDEMSHTQVQTAAYYSGKNEAGIVDAEKKSADPADSPEGGLLRFTEFPTA
jgi:alkaline phosphatase